MIREFKTSDFENIYELGELLHSNYRKLYNLDSIINEEYNHLFIYEDSEKILGFIHITKLYETIDIVDIVVDSGARHRGIGSNLLDYVISEYDDVKLITLEVNVRNKIAIAFYQKFGFEIVSLRKNYYNTDDAYLMKRGA